MFFSFFIWSSKLSRNMHKLRRELHNTTIYPPWGPIFKKIFFSKTSSSLIWNSGLALNVIFERYWWEESWIFLLEALWVTILRKVSRCLAFFKKMGWQSLLHGKMNLDLSSADFFFIPHCCNQQGELTWIAQTWVDIWRLD